MADPWDIPTFPTSGDLADYTTYEWIGRVLTQWERVEFELSITFSILSGEPEGEAMRDYGKGKIFRERLQGLQRAAECWFRKHPNQAIEGDFDRLCEVSDGFSGRRNDTAHGIVFNVSRMTFFRKKLTEGDAAKPQYLLIPPFYAMREHGDDGFPLYGYNSTMLRGLHESIFTLEMDWTLFNERLLTP